MGSHGMRSPSSRTMLPRSVRVLNDFIDSVRLRRSGNAWSLPWYKASGLTVARDCFTPPAKSALPISAWHIPRPNEPPVPSKYRIGRAGRSSEKSERIAVWKREYI
eukprot:7391758-Prymnesium_polylepis.2